MVCGFAPMAIFSAMALKRVPVSVRGLSRLGWVENWCPSLFRLSMRSAWRRAALKRALSHWSAERLCAARSRLTNSKSWRSEPFIWICARAFAETKKRNAAAKKTCRFLMAAAEKNSKFLIAAKNFSFLLAAGGNLKFLVAGREKLEFFLPGKGRPGIFHFGGNKRRSLPGRKST